MSKTSLKKVIKELDAEQLRQLLLDVYSARREAKQYLDFYADPDEEGLLARYTAALDKEAARTGRTRHPRFTRMKSAVKEFESYGPGAESIAQLRMHLLELWLRQCRSWWIKETHLGYIEKWLGDLLVWLDRQCMLTSRIGAIEEMLKLAGPPTLLMPRGSIVYRRLRDVIDSFEPQLIL